MIARLLAASLPPDVRGDPLPCGHRIAAEQPPVPDCAVADEMIAIDCEVDRLPDPRITFFWRRMSFHTSRLPGTSGSPVDSH